MLRLVLRRVAFLIPIAFVASLVVFALVLFIPGDVARTIAGQNATEAEVDLVRDRLGLDDPLVVQYGRWVSGAVTGDFGESLVTGQDVRGTILSRFPVTLSLTAGALLVTLAMGIPAGVLAAAFHDRCIDRLVRVGSSAPIAFPNYFVGMLLILVFAVWNEWLPTSQYVRPSVSVWGWIEHLILPSLALGLSGAAVVARQLRTAMVGVLDQEYIRAARARGLPARTVFLKHALKNAAVPVVTIVIAQGGLLLGGTVIIEQVFGIQGLGTFAMTGITQRDLPVIQGVVVFTTTIVLISNLVADVLYGWLNPRIRVA